MQNEADGRQANAPGPAPLPAGGAPQQEAEPPLSVEPSDASERRGRSLRLSIASTYDRRKTGDRFSVSSRLGGESICDRKPIADPFVRHRIIVHWWDAIKCLLRNGNITVEVTVDGDAEIVEDVLELDENYIGHGSTRRAEFCSGIEEALSKV